MKILSEIPPILVKGQMVALDLEIFHGVKEKLHRPIGDFACISICFDGKTVYQLYDKGQLKNAFKAIGKATLVFHNALFDLRQLLRWAEIKPRFIWDTMLVDQSMHGGLYQTFSLADLVRRWLNIEIDKTQQGSFENTDRMTADMKTYAATDAVRTWQIAQAQKEQFEDSVYFKTYMEVDEPMIWPVLEMPGIRVDGEHWADMIKGFESKVLELQTELGINVMSGNSVKNKAREFGVHLQDTQKETLEAFKDVPFIARVMEARTYRKAVSSYGMDWLTKWVESDGKIYCSYNITRAETGRMSAVNPPMQTIPQRKLPVYRTCFVPSYKSIMRVSDVSQQEPCILAYESKDPVLNQALIDKEDLHLTVARNIYNDFKMLKADPRRFVGKTLNLGLSYGLTPFGLAIRTGKSEEECEMLVKNYFSRFKGVFSWIGQQRNFAFTNGFVRSAHGRKMWLNTYSHQWQNNAINSPIQGGAADFTKVWTRKIWEGCQDAGIPYFIVALVHDEIVQDVLRELAGVASKIVDDAFKATALMLYPGVPFAFETEQGRSWACKQITSEMITEDDDE